MEKIENVIHQWKPMQEYQTDEEDEQILPDIEDGSLIGILKKIPKNQYFVLGSRGYSVEIYMKMIEKLKKHGLEIGKGDCEYGWKMPILNHQRELRVFRRRHQWQKE